MTIFRKNEGSFWPFAETKIPTTLATRCIPRIRSLCNVTLHDWVRDWKVFLFVLLTSLTVVWFLDPNSEHRQTTSPFSFPRTQCNNAPMPHGMEEGLRSFYCICDRSISGLMSCIIPNQRNITVATCRYVNYSTCEYMFSMKNANPPQQQNPPCTTSWKSPT